LFAIREDDDDVIVVVAHLPLLCAAGGGRVAAARLFPGRLLLLSLLLPLLPPLLAASPSHCLGLPLQLLGRRHSSHRLAAAPSSAHGGHKAWGRKVRKGGKPSRRQLQNLGGKLCREKAASGGSSGRRNINGEEARQLFQIVVFGMSSRQAYT
jgi:hypothetical protein